MPAYNFKKQFVPLVRSGEKTTTIRPYRQKRPTRIGDILYLYTGQRTKQCERIGVYRCIRISPIVIGAAQNIGRFPNRIQLSGRPVTLNGYSLAGWEIAKLAQEDGFPDSAAFFEFFIKVYGAKMPRMELLKWEPISQP